MKRLSKYISCVAYPLVFSLVIGANFVYADPTMPPPGVNQQAPTGRVIIRDATPVKLILDEDLKSGSAKVGDEIRYHLEFDLYSEDHQLVAPAGTKAFGKVLRSSGHGIFGKAGKLDISADYILAPDNTQIPLRGRQAGGSGKNEVVGMVALSVLVSPLGVLINGRDVTLHRGTQVPMYVDSDTPVTPFSGLPNSNSSLNRTIVMNDGTTYTSVVDHQDDDYIYLIVENGIRPIKKSDISSVTPSL